MAAEFKKLEAEKWTTAADMFGDAGSDYTGPSCQKKWELMVKKGEVDENGVYVGDDAEAPGDAEPEEDGVEENDDASEGEVKVEETS